MADTITLDAKQQQVVRTEGELRHERGKQRCKPDGGPRGDALAVDIEASGAELAAALCLNREWVCEFGTGGDVDGVEVRHTTHPTGRLIVHDWDDDDLPYALVRGIFPTYEVVGWMYGGEAKRKEYIYGGDGRPAYFVPTYLLHDIDELKKQGDKQ